MLYFKENPVL